LFLQTLSFLVAYRGSMLCQYSNSLLSLRSTLFSDPNEWLLREKLPLEEHTKLGLLWKHWCFWFYSNGG